MFQNQGNLLLSLQGPVSWSDLEPDVTRFCLAGFQLSADGTTALPGDNILQILAKQNKIEDKIFKSFCDFFYAFIISSSESRLNRYIIRIEYSMQCFNIIRTILRGNLFCLCS